MFKIGQTVYCAANGKGEVVQIEKWEYPIKVAFETREEVNYTFDGKMHMSLDRCLFFSKPVVVGLQSLNLSLSLFLGKCWR